MALLLSLCAVAVTGAVPDFPGRPGVAVLSGGAGQDGPAAGKALLLGGGRDSRAQVRLRVSLPPAPEDGGRWVLWMPRDPVGRIELDGGDWRGGPLGFYTPAPEEGLLPVGFMFPLPTDWQGERELRLEVDSRVRTALVPRLLTETQAMRLEQYGTAVVAMVYASLFTLALLALALYSAARDRMFLAFCSFSVLTLLTMAAFNGHLYSVPGLRAFALWGDMGLWALAMLYAVAWLQMLVQYVGLAGVAARARRVVDAYCVVLVALAALCLLDIAPLAPWMQPVATSAWALSVVAGLGILVDAGRRRVSMAWTLALMSLLTFAGAVLMELSARGRIQDMLAVRHGYQVCIVVSVALLAVGLVGRISEYRYQRDRELLARADTERRMQREAARSNLTAELQTELRSLAAGDVVWTAFRLLLDHIVRVIPVETAAVVVRGYHGQDLLVAEPMAAKAPLQEQAERRQLVLKRQCANGIPLQQPVIPQGVQAVVGTEAVVPLRVRSPAWGGLLLYRKGADGFSTEEIALAGELARLTLIQVDQAIAAIQLRRSAEVDALTGCFNRRTIDQWLQRAFNEAERDGQPVSVLFIDLDHFKLINDRYGHACGDYCLRNVASALRGALPEGDLLGRYGGEEFIAVLPGRGGAAARVIAEQLRAAVHDMRLEWSGQPLELTVSVGVATRRDGEDTPATTLERADKALYAAKRQGRNRVQVAPAVFS